MSELRVKEISKSFKTRKVVDHVSFDIKAGQVVG